MSRSERKKNLRSVSAAKLQEITGGEDADLYNLPYKTIFVSGASDRPVYTDAGAGIYLTMIEQGYIWW